MPQCRSGFMCQAGVCISACNPPCPAGQQCTDAGECAMSALPPPAYAPPPPPPPPVFFQNPPLPPPPPPPPGAREHDGFMMRATLGIGGAGITESLDDEDDPYEATFTGVALAFSLDIGGSPGRNLVLHARFAYLGAPSPDVEVNGEDNGESDYTVFNLLVAPAVTYYFMPINIYATAAVGLGWLGFARDRYDSSLVADSDNSDLTDVGFGMNIDVGKEFWVGRQWGLGFAGRFWLTASGGEYGGDDFDYLLTGFTVLFSATMQ